MKQFFFKTLICTGLAAPFFTGCTNDDVYDSEAVRQKAEKAFGIAIDPEQDWNMIETVKANISIKEDALSNYKFKVYTANPLYAESGATLLAEKTVQTDAKGNANADLIFDMPSFMEYVYVARVDDHGRRLVKSAKVNNGMLTTEFGGNAVGTRAMETSDLPTMECPYTEEQVDDLLKKGYDVVRKGQNGPNQYDPNLKPESLITNVQDLEHLTCLEGVTTHTWVIKGIFNGNLYSNNCIPDKTYKKFIEINQEWSPVDNGYLKFQDCPIIARDFKIVIANGGTWKISGISAQIGSIDIIVAAGGTLEINSTIQMTHEARIVVMPKKEMSDGTIIPGGKIISTVSGGNQWSNWCINPNSDKAVIYNAGEINVKWINFNNSIIYNASGAIMNLEGLNFSNDGDVVTNWGKINVDKIVGNGEQGTINNGCLLRSKEKINVKYLNQAKNTAIECKNIYFWQLSMRENSILRATNLSTNNTDIRYVGAEDGDALISAENINYLNNGSFTITDHIYFEANTYNDDGASTAPNASQYTGSYMRVILNAMKACSGKGLTRVGEASIVIPGNQIDDLSKAECTGRGNKPTDYVEETDTPNCYTYAFEDMDKDGGDYDMNDVVLQCSAPQDGKINVKLVAAGASKDLTIYFKNGQNGTETALFERKEVHDIFGVSKGELVNTGSGPNCNAVSTTIAVGENFSFKNNGDFYIRDEKRRESHVPAFDPSFKTGRVPYAICVPTAWQYPAERRKIGDVYPKFNDWAGDIETGNDWYVKESVSEN